MTTRIAAMAWLIPGGVLFVSAVAWPTAALLIRCVSDGVVPTDGLTFSPRQLGLLWRSIWLSGSAACASVLLSLPVAFAIGRSGRTGRGTFLLALLCGSLLCPPMVFAFGWQRILPAGVDDSVRCVGVWALWAWPIPALIIGHGWRRHGAQAYEAALLDTTPAGAFARIALPLMGPYVALCLLILSTLFFGDYGVPHACGILVYATELLAWSASSRYAIDTLWPALPSLLVVALLLGGLFVMGRTHAKHVLDRAARSSSGFAGRGFVIAVIAGFVVSWILPVAVLLWFMRPFGVVLDALAVYGRDLVWTLGPAVLAGIASVAMGLSIGMVPRLRGWGLAWAVLFAALPGALIGEAMIAAFQSRATWWIYDHWPMVALGYVARFGWIGLASAILVIGRFGTAQVEQARTDGAGHIQILCHVLIPAYWPTIVGTAAIITALAVAEVPTTSLVRVPSFSPISLVIIEKFHRFEDGMMIALSLWLLLTGMTAGFLISLSGLAAPTQGWDNVYNGPVAGGPAGDRLA